MARPLHSPVQMLLEETLMRRGLLAIAMLTLVIAVVDPGSAAACSPAARTQAYPARGRVVPTNVIPRALLVFGSVERETVELARDGVPVSAAIEVEDVSAGWFSAIVITPAELLEPGPYQVSGGDLEPTEFTVVEGEDVAAPGVTTDVAVDATYIESDGACFAGAPRVGLRFTPPEDDWTPADALAYHVYLATDRDTLAVDGAPSLPALARFDGEEELVITSPGGPEPGEPLTPGTWYVAVRAIDEAGNLGPPSEPVAFSVPDGAGCSVGGSGSSAAGGLAVLLALLCRRRQRSQLRQERW